MVGEEACRGGRTKPEMVPANSSCSPSCKAAARCGVKLLPCKDSATRNKNELGTHIIATNRGDSILVELEQAVGQREAAVVSKLPKMLTIFGQNDEIR